MAAVFISYCRESHEKARSLAQDLEALGYQTWFDQAITGGQAWWNSILGQIQKCDIFAFALELESLDSAACKREYAYAAKLGKSILPVLIADDVDTELLPGALAQIHFVDYRREDREAFRVSGESADCTSSVRSASGTVTRSSARSGLVSERPQRAIGNTGRLVICRADRARTAAQEWTA